MEFGRALAVGLLLVAACSDAESSTGTTTTAPASIVDPTTTTTSPPTTTPTPTTSTTSVEPTTTTTTTTTTPTTTTTTTTTTATTPATDPPSTTIGPTTVPTSVPGAVSVVVHRIPTEARIVALTFDAGSDLGNTALVLDLLAENGVIASFGITGDFARAHPDHVRRMAREGHVVMNHSDSHLSFTGVSSDDVLLDTASRQADLRAADAVLAPLVGHSTTPFWRPPFGDHDDSVLADVGAIGYGYTVMWTIDSLGWRGLAPAEITTRVLSQAEPGAIVLMHVGSQSADARALHAIIDGLRADGYSFTSAKALTGW